MGQGLALVMIVLTWAMVPLCIDKAGVQGILDL